ncbi:MAG: hypothetical protein WAO37_05480 [Thermacetogeniaceae bacterium]
MEDRQNDIIELFQTHFGKGELFARVFECFPYPIQVYAPDGTSVLVNKALLAEYGAVSPDMVVGKYNVFKDPDVIATGQLPALKRAFSGETVFFADVRVPLDSITKRYGIQDLDLEAVYQDIVAFPVLDNEKRVICVAAVLINRRVYRGKDEIERAREYM